MTEVTLTAQDAIAAAVVGGTIDTIALGSAGSFALRCETITTITEKLIVTETTSYCRRNRQEIGGKPYPDPFRVIVSGRDAQIYREQGL
jgi:hypothetical protein